MKKIIITAIFLAAIVFGFFKFMDAAFKLSTEQGGYIIEEKEVEKPHNYASNEIWNNETACINKIDISGKEEDLNKDYKKIREAYANSRYDGRFLIVQGKDGRNHIISIDENNNIWIDNVTHSKKVKAVSSESQQQELCGDLQESEEKVEAIDTDRLLKAVTEAWAKGEDCEFICLADLTKESRDQYTYISCIDSRLIINNKDSGIDMFSN